MKTDRRGFLGRLAAGVAALGAVSGVKVAEAVSAPGQARIEAVMAEYARGLMTVEDARREYGLPLIAEDREFLTGWAPEDSALVAMAAGCYGLGCRLTVVPELLTRSARQWTHDPLNTGGRYGRLEVDLYDIRTDEDGAHRRVNAWIESLHVEEAY